MFAHLHNHTKYSLLDATSKVEDIITALQEYGQTSFAVTDHGRCYNHPEMYRQFAKAAIKMIIGCEMYVCEDMAVHNKDEKFHHLVLLAENETGRRNLYSLVSAGCLDGFYKRPRIDFHKLQRHSEGLICLSACLAGEIARLLGAGRYEDAKALALKYSDLFGKDHYYLEFQAHDVEEQRCRNKQIVRLSRDTGIPLVVTCDSHYVRKEDADIHSIYVNIDKDRDLGETYVDCYVMSEDEVRSKISYLGAEAVEEAIANTVKISEMCNAVIPFAAPIIPHITIPTPYKSEVEYLKHLCNEGWTKLRLNETLNPTERKAYVERLFYEMDAIEKMGFAGYYLMVLDYVSQADRVGLGRGSCVGSMVAYLIGLTHVDPLQYNLYFERFIDVSALDQLAAGTITPKELKIPDVDTDFGKESRENIKRMLSKKHGPARVAAIGEFQYMRAKGAIKDVGRVLDIPFEVTNAMTSKFDTEGLNEVLQLGLLDEYKEEYPELFKYIEKLEGLPRSFSTHACGVVIGQQDLDFYSPLANNNGQITLQLDMHSCEDVGLVKVDLLGLRTLDIIYDVLDMIGKDFSYVHPSNINLKDDNVFALFREGRTNGVFQMESEGMMGVLKKIAPVCIEDIIACNALYRPGAMEYIDDFADRKNGVIPIEYLHPDLEPILKDTYGVMVYQEQLIQVGRLAGMRNPDKLRKACGKKDMKLLATLEPEVKGGLKQRGWSEDQANQIWDDMVKFGRYSFNKSHSAAYGITAYITAYLKYYHPAEFMAATLNSFVGKIDRIPKYVYECRDLNVPIAPFDWRNVSSKCTLQDGRLIYGLHLIKNFNADCASELQTLNRREYPSFTRLLCDLSNTSIDKRMIEGLINLGFFEEFGGNARLLEIFEQFNRIGNRKSIKKAELEDSLGYLAEIVPQHAQKETAKQFSGVDMAAVIEEWERIVPDKALAIQDQVKAEISSLNFCASRFKTPTSFAIALNINDKYTPRVEFYHLDSGKIQSLKVPKRKYYIEGQCAFEQFDIVRLSQVVTKPKVKLIGDKWVEQPETEQVLEAYQVIRKAEVAN